MVAEHSTHSALEVRFMSSSGSVVALSVYSHILPYLSFPVIAWNVFCQLMSNSFDLAVTYIQLVGCLNSFRC